MTKEKLKEMFPSITEEECSLLLSKNTGLKHEFDVYILIEELQKRNFDPSSDFLAKYWDK